jgi:hypothetical protein
VLILWGVGLTRNCPQVQNSDGQTALGYATNPDIRRLLEGAATSDHEQLRMELFAASRLVERAQARSLTHELIFSRMNSSTSSLIGTFTHGVASPLTSPLTNLLTHGLTFPCANSTTHPT